MEKKIATLPYLPIENFKRVSTFESEIEEIVNQ